MACNIYTLQIEHELRIYVGETNTIDVELTSGLAEIYGAEMELQTTYTFPPHSNIAIFTWHGCTLKVNGNPENVTTVQEEECIISVVLHAMLEERRIKADVSKGRGPVTLIAGPKDAGKSTMCHILLNYATRLGHKPIFMDLDVGQNSISMPGIISLASVEKPSKLAEGFEYSSMQNFHFGHNNPSQNIGLYFLLIDQLGRTLKAQLNQPGTKSSGAVINTCGWIDGPGYKALTRAALAFEIDILCVIGSRRLYSSLLSHMPSCVKVLFLQKLKGSTHRTKFSRSQLRKNMVKNYFFGLNNQLQPHTMEIKFSDFEWFRVFQKKYNVEVVDVSLDQMRMVNELLSVTLRNQVVAVSSSNTSNTSALLAHILGFILVTEVDLQTGLIKVIKPNADPIPNKVLLVGDIVLTESFRALNH